MTVKLLLRLEFLVLFFIFGYFLLQNSYASWWLLLLFWLPDLGFLPYLINPRWGSIGYNLTHFLGTGALLVLLGWYFGLEWLVFAGLLDLTHIHFDRFFGYGLKFSDNFNHTHLGWIGQDKAKNNQ
jgi:Domain of unknown function (DUF4260)